MTRPSLKNDNRYFANNDLMIIIIIDQTIRVQLAGLQIMGIYKQILKKEIQFKSAAYNRFKEFTSFRRGGK